MSDTTAHPPRSHAQTVTAGVRALLLRLGATNGLAARVLPRSDITGRPYVYVPALPLDVAERLLTETTPAGETP